MVPDPILGNLRLLYSPRVGCTLHYNVIATIGVGSFFKVLFHFPKFTKF